MITEYCNGTEFYEENKEFLLTNKDTEVFFRLDAPLLTNVNKEEFAIKIEKDGNILLALSKLPYNIMFFGSSELASEMAAYLLDNDYKLRDFLTTTDVGDALIKAFSEQGKEYKLSIGMDFMEAHSRFAPSDDRVETAKPSDIDEIFELLLSFIKDCGLKDEISKDDFAEVMDSFRVIRVDGKIVSFARMCLSSKESKKIATVYTRNEYRGKGYSKAICNVILNEIFDMGMYATLNVDQKNPISYHLYESIGFKKTFSQGIYELKE